MKTFITALAFVGSVLYVFPFSRAILVSDVIPALIANLGM
jgi:hypothetical protein